MAKIIPDNRTLSPPERKFLKFVNQDPKTKDWIVFPALPLNKYSNKYHGTDIDFLILAPNIGFIVFEIKGNFKIEDGKWSFMYKNQKWKTDESPLDRIKDTKFSFKQYLFDRFDYRSPLLKIIVADFVSFPNNNFNVELPLENSKLRIIDNNILESQPLSSILSARVREMADKAKKNGKPSNIPDKKQCEIIKSDIMPDSVEDNFLKKLTDDTLIQIESFTEEQSEIIKALSNTKKFFLTGGASTGKTILAQTLAMKFLDEGKSILYLAPTLALVNQTNFNLQNPKFNHEPGLAADFGSGFNSAITVNKAMHYYFNSSEPRGASNYLKKMKHNEIKKFEEKYKADVLIVDEIQDYLSGKSENSSNYIDLFEKMVKGGFENGTIVFCGDIFNQKLFKKDKMEESLEILTEVYNFTPLNLSRNCRNPKKVIDHLVKETNIEPPQVMFQDDRSPNILELKYSEVDKTIEGLCKQVQKLKDEGIDVGDIVVISDTVSPGLLETLNQHSAKNFDFIFINDSLPVQDFEIDDQGDINSNVLSDYNKIREKQIQICSIRQFRGCEASWVIVLGNNKLDNTKKYIAYTRSKAGLITITRNENI
tara:strand:+ start:3533 stop:5317 length:1785 start_codon:yes stop_codon:yes gene_type:complete